MADIDLSLLARYAAGDCTAEERVVVEQWLAEAPAHAVQLAAIREVAAVGERVNSAGERTETLARIRRRVAVATAEVGRSRVPPAPALPARRLGSPLLRLAAAIVGIVGASLLGYVLLRRQPVAIGAAAPAVRTFTAPRAGRLSLRLPDGTLAELAPATTLRLPAAYGTRDRTVELLGEAAFTVTHDAQRPFAVHTQRLVAQDLGTRFVVREYQDDAAAEIAVAEGTVAVTRRSSVEARDSRRLVLNRGQGARTTADSLVMLRDVPLDSYFGWTEGRLAFRGTPLDDAVVQLGRWYDIDVRLASPTLAALRLNATFESTETAAAVLQMIADAFNLHLVRNGRVYTLSTK